MVDFAGLEVGKDRGCDESLVDSAVAVGSYCDLLDLISVLFVCGTGEELTFDLDSRMILPSFEIQGSTPCSKKMTFSFSRPK